MLLNALSAETMRAGEIDRRVEHFLAEGTGKMLEHITNRSGRESNWLVSNRQKGEESGASEALELLTLRVNLAKEVHL